MQPDLSYYWEGGREYRARFNKWDTPAVRSKIGIILVVNLEYYQRWSLSSNTTVVTLCFDSKQIKCKIRLLIAAWICTILDAS